MPNRKAALAAILPNTPTLSSAQSGWEGIALEYFRYPPFETPEYAYPEHKIAIHTPSQLSPSRLKLAIEYIHDNLGKNIALTDLAGIANLSLSQFSRVFRQETGLSPYQYSLHARTIIAALTNRLPPIFDNTPESIVPSQIIAEFPLNTFLENIAVDARDNLFITSYEEGKIYRVTNGEIAEVANVNGNAAGIAIDDRGDLLIAGATQAKVATVFRIHQNGKVESIITIPDAIFLNGMTHLAENRYLIADSYLGAIWEINSVAKTAQIWLQHERLARFSKAEATPTNPNHPFPAVNGLKIYNNTLYASNTQRQHLIRIPINTDLTAGLPELWLTNVNLDDFAFDISGNLYGTTHVYNSVVKITPEDLPLAQAFMDSEPYNRAGIFARVTIRLWQQVLPESQPGELFQKNIHT